MRYLSLIIIFTFSIIFSGRTLSGIKEFSLLIPSEKKMAVGEELRYVVKYSLLELGEVTLKVKGKKIIKGKTYYSTAAFIDSYSGIPFVDLHQIYESDVNSELYSNYFRGLVRGEEYTSYTEYKFDYEKNIIQIEKGKLSPPQVWTDSTTTADKKYQDGLSLFYYARMNTGKKKSEKVPCFVTEEKVETNINFYSNPVEVSIDAVDYDIDCVRLDGSTDFVSVFGLTGYFEGWFSNDEAAIPIIAKMKVIIGNVTLELVEWKREGWNPPRYKK